jgi:UDP-N-acetylglucosamine 2-epimerase
MKLLSVVGARPQFVKIAPFARAFARRAAAGQTLEHVLVHTGQHYDAGMSDVFFDELELPKADYHLGVGSGGHGVQTARMLEGIERVLLETRPDMVLVYGDTNSTVAGALAAAKLHIAIGHVEAGLRSFNRHMPEEINRVVADHLADLLFAPTATAVHNLEREGLAARTVPTGDAMHDAVLFNRALAAQRSKILERLGLAPHAYGVVTVHRAENTDDLGRLERLLTGFNRVAAAGLTLVFPLHPRTAGVLKARLPQWAPHARLQLIEPLGYLDMVRLVDNARVTLTDSGGLQKEAFFLDCPCVTLRDETEWVETVEAGGNVLVGTDPERLVAAVAAWHARFPSGKADFAASAAAAFGRGDSAERTLDSIIAFAAAQRAAQAQRQ